MHPVTILLQTDAEAEAAAGIIALFGGTMFFAILVVWALTVVGMWKLFVKAGHPGWASIIPIYNIVVLGQIVGWTGLKIVMLFVPLVNIVFALVLALDIARVFGKSSAFAVGLLLLPMIFFPLLGFDDSSYLGPDARPVMATA